MNKSEVKQLLLNIPIVLCRNMNNRLISTIIKDLNYDISHHHLMILKILYEKKSMYITEIVNYLGIPKPQMTASLDHLIELGFVTRVHSKKDRRKITVNITDKGKKNTLDALNKIENKISKIFKSLTDEEIQTLGNGIEILFKLCRFYEGT